MRCTQKWNIHSDSIRRRSGDVVFGVFGKQQMAKVANANPAVPIAWQSVLGAIAIANNH